MKSFRKKTVEKINKKLMKVKEMSDLEFSIVFNSNSKLKNLCLLDITNLMLNNKKYYFSYEEIKNIKKGNLL